jgi:hypothetical protein
MIYLPPRMAQPVVQLRTALMRGVMAMVRIAIFRGP